MIIQAVCSFILLVGIFLLSFHLEVKDLGVASNLNAMMIVFGGTFLPRSWLILFRSCG